jgi:acyl-CoA synthetase (AMP-forming)/AMP-acid ligase II
MINKKELLYFSLRNQYLLNKTEKSTVLSDLCGLQAQFANNPKYALRIRANDFSETDWGQGLVKIWSFRSTLHAVKIQEIGLFLSARGVPETWEDSWTGLRKEIKPYWSEFIYECILGGINGREELKEKCRNKGMEQDVLEKVFHGWGGLLKEMCDRGMIAYDIGTAKRFVVCKDIKFLGMEEARGTLIKRYFKAFAPATIDDCARFTGYKKREVLRLIEENSIPLKSITCEGIEYFYLNDISGECKIPQCLYLAGFDQLIMGYMDRSRFMDEEDKRKVITSSGIVHPTILLEGKLQAKWKKDGAKLIITPFAKLSKKNQSLIISKGKKLFSEEIEDVIYQDPVRV